MCFIFKKIFLSRIKLHRLVCCSGQQEPERRQQAEHHSHQAGGSNGHGTVAQVGIAAHVGVVEGDPWRVFLSTHVALGGNCAAFFVQRQL